MEGSERAMQYYLSHFDDFGFLNIEHLRAILDYCRHVRNFITLRRDPEFHQRHDRAHKKRLRHHSKVVHFCCMRCFVPSPLWVEKELSDRSMANWQEMVFAPPSFCYPLGGSAFQEAAADFCARQNI